MKEVSKIEKIYDISLSYKYSVEHQEVAKQNKRKIEFRKYEPPRKIMFFPPEYPIKFEPSIDFKILTNSAWICQPKYDGWRVIIISDKEGIKFYSRKGKKIDVNLPIILPEGCMIDGELICVDGSSTNYKVHKNLKNPDKLLYIAFDIMYWDYRNLCYQPLIERMECLKKIEQDKIKVIENIPKDYYIIQEVFEMGYEGVVFKNIFSRYEDNGANWIKLKDMKDLDEAIKYLTNEERSIFLS